MKKRVLAMVMTLMMAVAFMPTFAFADEPQDPPKGSVEYYEQQLAELSKNIKQNRQEILDTIKQLQQAKSEKAAQALYDRLAGLIKGLNEEIKTKAAYDIPYDQLIKQGQKVAADYAELIEAVTDLNKVLFNENSTGEERAKAIQTFGEFIDQQLWDAEQFDNAINYLNSPEVKAAVGTYIRVLEDMRDVVQDIAIQFAIYDWDALNQKIQDQCQRALDQLDAARKACEAAYVEYQKACEQANAKIKDAAFEAYQKARDAYHQAQAQFAKIYNQYEQICNNAIKQAKEQYKKARIAYEKAFANYQKACNQASTKIREQARKQLDKAHAAYEAAVEQYNAIIAKIGDIHDQAVEQAYKVAYEACKKAEEAYQQARDAYATASEQAREAAKKAYDQAVAAYDEALKQFEAAREAYEAAREAACAQLQEAYQKALDQCEAAYDAFKQASEDVREAACAAYQQAIEQYEAVRAEVCEQIKQVSAQIEWVHAWCQQELIKVSKEIAEACAYVQQISWDEVFDTLDQMISDAIEMVKNDTAALKERQKEEVLRVLAECQRIVTEMRAEIKEVIAETEACCKIIDEYLDEVMACLQEQTEEALARAEALMEEMVAELQPYVQEINAQLEKLAGMVAADLQAALDKIGEDINAIILAKVAAVEAAVEKAVEVYEAVSDKVKEQLGIAIEDAKALAQDVVAYAMGYAGGEGYLKLQEDLADALATVEGLEAQAKVSDATISALETRLTQTTAELEQQEQTAKALFEQLQTITNDDSVYAKKLNNAKDLTKVKVSLNKKGTKSKSGKITAKWKKVKPTVSKYVVYYKSGKKATKKKVANTKTAYKIPKKFKKGKKVTVKVKAIYTIEYKGIKLTYSSKWSKAKKVTVK